MARFVGIGNAVFVNPEHVISVFDREDTTVVETANRLFTTSYAVGEVVDLLEAEPVVL